MRIAYLINQYPKVSHSFIRREIQALERRGLSVFRITLRPAEEPLVDPEDLQEQAKTQVVLTHFVGKALRALLVLVLTHPLKCVKAVVLALRLGWRSDRGVLYHFAYLLEACVVGNSLVRDKSQHLHAHFGTNSATVALLASTLTSIPFSFTAHGTETFDKPEALKLKTKIELAAFVVGVSQHGRAQLLRWAHRRDWDKLKVIHCGLDRRGFESTPRGIPNTPTLVCVGRLSEEKGQSLLLSAVHELHRDGIACDLVFAGDGLLRRRLEDDIANSGLQAHVRITGWLSGSEVRKEMLLARALVLPSLAEGLPVVIMEAFSLGRPVLATYVGGVPELVKPGESGWLVPAGDRTALVAALKDVLQAPVGQLEEMGEKGRARVLQAHDVDAEAGKLAELFT